MHLNKSWLECGVATGIRTRCVAVLSASFGRSSYLQLPQEVEACSRLHLLGVQVEGEDKHREDDGRHDL